MSGSKSIKVPSTKYCSVVTTAHFPRLVSYRAYHVFGRFAVAKILHAQNVQLQSKARFQQNNHPGSTFSLKAVSSLLRFSLHFWLAGLQMTGFPNGMNQVWNNGYSGEYKILRPLQ